MNDLTRLRDAIEALPAKLEALRGVISGIKDAADVQGSLDQLTKRVEEIGRQIDEIVAENQPEPGPEPEPATPA